MIYPSAKYHSCDALRSSSQRQPLPRPQNAKRRQKQNLSLHQKRQFRPLRTLHPRASSKVEGKEEEVAAGPPELRLDWRGL